MGGGKYDRTSSISIKGCAEVLYMFFGSHGMLCLYHYSSWGSPVALETGEQPAGSITGKSTQHRRSRLITALKRIFENLGR